MPLNVLLVEALRDYDRLTPGEITVEYPTGSGTRVSITAAADDISRRLLSIFLPGRDGRRPVLGGTTAGHRPAVAGQRSRSTSTSTATPEWVWAPRIRRAGRRSSRTS